MADSLIAQNLPLWLKIGPVFPQAPLLFMCETRGCGWAHEPDAEQSSEHGPDSAGGSALCSCTPQEVLTEPARPSWARPPPPLPPSGTYPHSASCVRAATWRPQQKEQSCQSAVPREGLTPRQKECARQPLLLITGAVSTLTTRMVAATN